MISPHRGASALRYPQRSAVCAGSFVALMYHNVSADKHDFSDVSPSATSYFVTEDSFAEQLSLLSVDGTPAIASDLLEQFYDQSDVQDANPEANGRSVLFTFDDGWRGVVDRGGPLLEQYGLTAILFVTTSFLDQKHFLSRSALRHLNADVFHVGSHARTHRMLSLLGDNDIRAELAGSKKLLEDLTGHPVDLLSIPSGAVDARVRRIARECGYRFVFDSEVRVNHRGDDPLAIGRIALSQGTSLSEFRRYISGRLRREQVRRTLLRCPKRLLGLRRYEKLRRLLLGEQPRQQVTHLS